MPHAVVSSYVKTVVVWLSFLLFLAPQVQADPFFPTNYYSLSVNASGASFVPISSFSYGGLAGYTKTNIPESSYVTLTAPSSFSGKSFNGWSGCNSTSGLSCTVIMTSSRFVTVYYSSPPATLSVNASGNSAPVTITSTGGYGGIANYAKFNINSGTTISLTAPISAGTTSFIGWSGCDQAAALNCTVSMTGSRSVVANYGNYGSTLSVTTTGATGVAISGTPGYTGTANYVRSGIDPATLISLSAPGSVGTAVFTGWSGCDAVSGSGCTVTMSNSKAVQANYAVPVNVLSVTASGASAVVITNGSGYGGTANYTKNVPIGTAVTLTAPSTSGAATFSGWSGCDSTAVLACTVTMSSSKTVAANYVTPLYSLSVISSGASAVPITNGNGYGGTANYTAVNIAAGTSITLTAPATMGSAIFSSWSGCDVISTLTCTVTMNNSKFVSANYSTVSHNLNVIAVGAPPVTVSNSNGYGGLTDYTKTGIAPNTTFALQVPTIVGPNANYTLTGLSGCNGYNLSTGICSVLMDSSKFVVAQYSPTVYSLSVTTTGASSVAITGSGGYSGIANYTATGIATGTAVTLTAPASAGNANFSSWTGCDSVSGTTCSVTMSAAKFVSADYVIPTYSLSVAANGATAVVIAGTNNYGGTANYTMGGISAGTSITLTAPASVGNANFSTWTGCDTVTTTACTVTMSSARFVTVDYATPTYSLGVNSNGATAVAISSSGSYGGSANYAVTGIAAGTSITLTAPLSAGTATFSNWSGCDTALTVTCTVTLNSSRFVTANYTSKDSWRLSVNSSGVAGVAVSSIAAYAGTANYSVANIANSTIITLAAPATAGGKSYNGWTGCDNTNAPTFSCTVTMTANKTVTVNYSYSLEILTRVATDRILKQVNTTNGSVSTARFSAGASGDGGRTFGDTFTSKDTVLIGAGVTPQAQDIGKAVDIFIVIRTTRDGAVTWTYKTDKGFLPWSGRVLDLEPAARETAREGMAYEVWDGAMTAGTHQIFVGYQVAASAATSAGGSAGSAGAAGPVTAPAPLHYTGIGMDIKVSP